MVKKSSSSKSTRLNSSDNIKFIRLVTGEDIVSEVTDIANGKMYINNPLKVVYTPSMNTGFLSISLMQWVFTRISKNQSFDMDLHNILIMTDADDHLVEHYKESLLTFSKKGNDDDTEYDTLEEQDGIDMLNNLIDKIKSKNNKGKLH
jgi:hypothetical protein